MKGVKGKKVYKMVVILVLDMLINGDEYDICVEEWRNSKELEMRIQSIEEVRVGDVDLVDFWLKLWRKWECMRLFRERVNNMIFGVY